MNATRTTIVLLLVWQLYLSSHGTTVCSFSIDLSSHVRPSNHLTTTTTTSTGSRPVKGNVFLTSRATSTLLSWNLQAKSICFFDETDFDGSVGDWPYEAKDFNRIDNSSDEAFYNVPRLVTHIDDDAIAALTKYYEEEFTSFACNNKKKDLDVLDLCSSWISHLPEPPQDDVDTFRYNRVVGLGMNEEELKVNKQLTDYVVQDLNEEPSLVVSKFEDDSFDIICNVVSVDYLTKPRTIFEEMHRILRPNGIALMSFSNRCFPTKAIAMWLQADTLQRLAIVGSYFYYSSNWKSIEALDLKERLETPPRPSAMELLQNPSAGFAWMNSAAAVSKANQGDPMYIVKGVK